MLLRLSRVCGAYATALFCDAEFSASARFLGFLLMAYSFAAEADFLSPTEWLWKVRVGANSPSL